MITIRRTWATILTQREALEIAWMVVAYACLGVAAIVGAADPSILAQPLFRLGGFALTGEVSLGQLGALLVVVVQIGRWGRRTVARYAHVPEELEKINLRLSAIERCCPVRAQIACPEDIAASHAGYGPGGI